MDGMFVLCIGSPVGGFAYIGPFRSEDQADRVGCGNDDWWVLELDCGGGAADRDGQHIVVVVDINGFYHYGPFSTEEDASAFVATLEEPAVHCIELTPP